MAATATTEKKAGVPKAPAATKRTKAKAGIPAGPKAALNGKGRANGTAAETVVNKTGLPRLGKNGLSVLVAGHLAEHPRADLSPSELANKLNRSGGAIANALERLVAQGRAVRISDRPRRYKHKAAKAARATAKKP